MRATDKDATRGGQTEAVRDEIQPDGDVRDDVQPDDAIRDEVQPDEADRVVSQMDEYAREQTLLEEAGRVEVHRDEAARDESGLSGLDDNSTEDSNVDTGDAVATREPGQAADTEVPGDSEGAAEPRVMSPPRAEAVAPALLPGAEGIRDRWRDVQLRFVDDPRSAADQAAELVDEVTQSLVTALESRRTELGAWRDDPVGGSTADTDAGSGQTEQLRVAVQRYREFIDRVLGL
jgi:hypothetical protein